MLSSALAARKYSIRVKKTWLLEQGNIPFFLYFIYNSHHIDFQNRYRLIVATLLQYCLMATLLNDRWCRDALPCQTVAKEFMKPTHILFYSWTDPPCLAATFLTGRRRGGIPWTTVFCAAVSGARYIYREFCSRRCGRWEVRRGWLNIIVSSLYVCVHTADGYDLEIAILTLKFTMDGFFAVLQRSFIFTPEVTMVTFEGSRSFDRLSLWHYILVHPPFVNSHTFVSVECQATIFTLVQLHFRSWKIDLCNSRCHWCNANWHVLHWCSAVWCWDKCYWFRNNYHWFRICCWCYYCCSGGRCLISFCCLVTGCALAVSLLLSLATVPPNSRRSWWRGIGEEGAWLTKAEVEGDVNEAAAGGEVQGGVPTWVPNRKKFWQSSSHKLGVIHGQ